MDNTLRTVESRWREVSTSPIRPTSSSRQPLLLSSSTSSSSSPRLVVTRKRQRIGWRLLFTTFAIVALSAGLAILLLLWIVFIRGVPSISGESVLASAIRTGAFLVDEGTETDWDGSTKARLLVLTFSSVTTQIVSATIPLLIMMTAYCTAGAWLGAQEKGSSIVHEEKALPTPAQFGLLVKLSSSPGLVSIYQTASYLTRGRKGLRETTPALFTSAFFAVVVIYFISHLISLADLWLHISSSAVIRNSTTPIDVSSLLSHADLSPSFSASNPYPLSLKFNDTLCSTVDCIVPDPALGIWDGFPTVVASGYLIASNSTSLAGLGLPNPGHPLSVVTLADENDLAIITPGSSNKADFHGSVWIGSTYGMRAKCVDVTPLCGKPPAAYDCAKAGYPGFPKPNTTILADNVIIKPFDSALSNPYTFPIAFGWDNVLNLPPGSVFVRNDGGHQVSFATCQIECFNLTVSHDGHGRYHIVNGSSFGEGMVRSKDAFVNLMLGPLAVNMPNSRVQMNVQIHIVAGEPDTSIIAALNQELARVSLGMFAGSVVTQPPYTLSISNSSIVSRYETTPVLTYTSLIFLYAIVVLVIFIWASGIQSPIVKAGESSMSANSKGRQEERTTTALELAHSLLTDSLSLVGLAIPQSLNGVDEGGSGALKKPLDRFGEVGQRGGAGVGAKDTWTSDREKGGGGGVRRRAPRLRLGVVEEGPKAGMMFGVSESRGSS